MELLIELSWEVILRTDSGMSLPVTQNSSHCYTVLWLTVHSTTSTTILLAVVCS